MNKRTRFNLTLFIIIAIVILLISGAVLLLVLIKPTKQTALGTECIGGQVLSIDNVGLRYSDELKKDVVRVVFSTITTGECLEIKVSSDKIKEELKSSGRTDFQVKNGIMGDIMLTTAGTNFLINEKQNNKFRKFSITNKGKQAFCTDGDCNNVPGLIASLFKGLPGSDCLCIYESEQGVGAEFLSTQEFTWTAIISIGDQLAGLTEYELSSKVGDIAFVKWAGNLKSNIALNPPNKDSYKPYSTNKFIMIDKLNFDIFSNEYFSIKNILDKQDVTAVAGGNTELAYSYNAKFETVTKDVLNSWITQEPAVEGARIFTSGLTSGNKLIVDLKTPVVFPQFTLDIDAEEVGIFITSGKPKITCPEKFDIISGSTSNQIFRIQNIGEHSGAFSYSLDCNKGSQVLQPSPPQSLNKGDIILVNLVAGLTVQEGTDTATCTFTAKDMNSLESDSCSFDYSSTKQTKCIEGDKTCEGGNTQLWTCLADGTYYEEKCKFGCVDINGAKCKTEEESETGIVEECKIKAQANPLMGYSLTETCGFNPLCWSGITKPKQICSPTYLKYWILGGFLVFLTIIIVIIVLIKSVGSGGGGQPAGVPIIINR